MPADAASPPRLTTLQSLRLVFSSPRTTAVALQSFCSGMPLGLIWVAVPAWMALVGVDIKTIGLLALSQAPWTFKFLWSPLMDRYTPPFLGRKRGWAVIALVGIAAGIMGLAIAAREPLAPWSAGGVEIPWVWVVGALSIAVALASTVQDIAIDAYAVEVLRPEEHGIAVGARTSIYRAGLTLAGAIAISAAGWIGWSWTLFWMAALHLAGILVVVLSPEPEGMPRPPSTLRAAVWEPLVGLLSKHRALEIAAFLFFYKFGDNLAQALLRPFLVQNGYGTFDVGIATGTIGLVGTLVGAFAGGILTTRIGLGRSLWIFGFLQAISNLGYVWIASIGPNRPIMYAAIGFETLTQGLGTGAFGVLLLRLTQKRFSATQYALLSSLFALGRVLTGPMTGFLVDAMGWRPFFLLTIAAAAPGLVFLHRFVPLGAAEPVIVDEPPSTRPKLPRVQLLARGAAGFAIGLVAAAVTTAALDTLRAHRADPGAGYPFGAMILGLLRPESVAGWSESIGVFLAATFTGLAAAALAAARRGVRD
jgi:PAT family beta-lactamase induction signal transducer AmpG